MPNEHLVFYRLPMKLLPLAGVAICALLNTPILAQEFHDPDGSALAEAIERQFVRPMLSLPETSNAHEIFQWMALDVNGDDYDELFIKLTGETLCSPKNCPIIAFMRQPDQSWGPILTAVGESVKWSDDILIVTNDEGTTSYQYDQDIAGMIPVSESSQR